MDACTSGEEIADLHSLDGSTHPLEGIKEEGDPARYSAEEQIHGGCDAKTLSCKSKTLACDSKTSDWEGLEDTRMSSGSGEGRVDQSRTSTNFDSEPECLDDDGAPASGSNYSTNCNQHKGINPIQYVYKMLALGSPPPLFSSSQTEGDSISACLVK